MSYGMVAVAGATLIGGMMSADAASSASGKQVAATNRATDIQKQMFDKQIELQQPFRDTGLNANNRLAYLLGLSTDPGGVSGSGSSGLSYDQLRAQLAPQFTRQEEYTVPIPIGYYGDGEGTDFGQRKTRTIVDQNGLDKSIQSRMQQQMQEQSALEMARAGGDSNFGSLMRDFSAADFEADPGYAFRQSEGMKGIENSAAARGGLLSGGALKGIQRFGQDLASQEYGNAYQRFNANQTNKYNRLAGIVNTGQGATNQVSNAAGQFGQQAGSNMIGAGNAQAAGIVGGANAINGAIGQGSNIYQQNQLMDLIRRPNMNYYNAGGSGAMTTAGSQQTRMLNEQWS